MLSELFQLKVIFLIGISVKFELKVLSNKQAGGNMLQVFAAAG
jgi:hypothetical protein